MRLHLIMNVALAASTIAAVGCDRSEGTSSSTRASSAPAASQPDNTARNRMDKDSQAKTPMDQSNSSADVQTTAEIRRAVMEDKSMSMNAQNCKIITDKSGVVTLRGPVDSQAEKDSIEAKAKAVAGVTQVVNELEVKTN